MRRLIAITVLALPLLISSWTTSHAIDQPAPGSLSAKDRTEILETVWKTINDEYYDPTFNGVDWSKVRERYRPRVDAAKGDDEFYLIIKQMLLELQDLHTGFVAPGEQTRSSGISVYEVEDKVVVINVVPDSDAASAGVKAGMIVRSFDGKPIEARVAELQASLGRWTNTRAHRLLIYSSLLAVP